VVREDAEGLALGSAVFVKQDDNVNGLLLDFIASSTASAACFC
jgi:hypothetical protein